MQLHWLMIKSLLNQLFLSGLLLVQSQLAIETIDCVEVVVKIIEDLYLRVPYLIKLRRSSFTFVRLRAFWLLFDIPLFR